MASHAGLEVLPVLPIGCGILGHVELHDVGVSAMAFLDVNIARSSW